MTPVLPTPSTPLFDNLDAMVSDWTAEEIARHHRPVRLVPDVLPSGQVRIRAEPIAGRVEAGEISVACVYHPGIQRHLFACAEVQEVMVSFWREQGMVDADRLRDYFRRPTEMLTYGMVRLPSGDPTLQSISKLGRAGFRGNGRTVRMFSWEAWEPLVRGALDFVRAIGPTGVWRDC